MISADELSHRVLAELNEAWTENIFAMLNTIIEPTGQPAEVAAFTDALKSLVNKELALLAVEAFFPANPEPRTKIQSLDMLAKLGDWFTFDHKRTCWTLRNGELTKARIPVIKVTSLGRDVGWKLLEQNGYQWWRPRK